MKVSALFWTSRLAIPQLRQVCDSFDSAAKAVWTVAHEPGQVNGENADKIWMIRQGNTPCYGIGRIGGSAKPPWVWKTSRSLVFRVMNPVRLVGNQRTDRLGTLSVAENWKTQLRIGIFEGTGFCSLWGWWWHLNIAIEAVEETSCISTAAMAHMDTYTHRIHVCYIWWHLPSIYPKC